MKTIINLLAALVLLIMTACSSNEVEVENIVEGDKVPVRVHVNEFSISMSSFDDIAAGARGFTRADSVKYTEVKACVLAFYDINGTEAYKATQIYADAATYTTFGKFEAKLPIGHYKMVAMGYVHCDGDVFTLTSPTQAEFGGERPRETFSLVQDVMVTKDTPLDLEVTLDRISSWLSIKSTDGRSASVTKIRTTFGKGGKSFDPTTGLSLTDKGFSQTNSPSAAVGATIWVSSCPFLHTDEETMDVTIEALDKDDVVLFTKVIENVDFKRSCKTIIQGPIFTAGTSSAGFKLNTEWKEGETYTFE